MRSPRMLLGLAALGAVLACGPGAPPLPACAPPTCGSLSVQCGEVPDGCGGVLECGSCAEGEACGAGGAHLCGAATMPCEPITCEAAGKNCGELPDGCGGTVDCGSCAGGQTCSGGGVANVCGAPPCQPTTCEAQGASCGRIPDGCGGTLECGSCGAGQTCGGGGVPNACGAPPPPPPPPCQPTTCAAQGATCGTIPNGCGGTLTCGGCPAGETCGGGGTPNACGAPAPPPCEPTTCEAEGATCGSIPDGCGGTLECGTCPAGETCGGGGTANVCAVPAPPPCQPTTCADAGASCGPIADGCGGTVDCGTCPTGEICGAGGTPGVCAAPPAMAPCEATTCDSVGGSCGSIPDGCGGMIVCGCPDGQTCGPANLCGAPS